MKKLLEKRTYITLLLLVTIASYGQTYQNPTFGTVTTKTAPTTTTDPYVSSINANGVIGKVAPENIPVNVIPPTTHYTPTTPTLKGHFQGIDNAIGNIPLTTAGNTTRVWFTGDATTIGAGTFYLTNPTNKGTVANVSQSVTNDDNQKKYFTQDLIGQPFATATLFPPGVYAGNLSASTTPNSAQQRFTVELYKCNNAGTPIASGVPDAPVGDLGVTVVLILDSGLLTLADGSVTNVPVSASLASQFSIGVGERIRYHVSAEKVGTASSNITESIWYGNSFNSFIDVPTPITSSGVSNVSTVGGATVTNALDNLNVEKVGGLGTNTFLPVFTGTNTLGDSQIFRDGVLGYKIGNIKTTFGHGLSVSKAITTTNAHIFDDYSLITPNVPSFGFGVFDASTEMAGTLQNDHFVGMQSRLTHSSTGPLTGTLGLTGFLVANIQNGGLIDDAHGVYIRNPQGTGAITNNYGIKLEAMTKGSALNYAIYSLGGRSSFSGDFILRGGASYNSYGIGDETTTDSKYASLYNNGTDTFVLTTGKGTFSSTIPNIVFAKYNGTVFTRMATVFSTTGNFVINSTTDTGVASEKLQVNGNITASAATTANQVVIKSQLDAKADIASPSFTGDPKAPTPTAGDNDTSIATTAFVVANLGTKSLYELFTDTSNTTTSLETLSSYTLTAGTLPNNGDRIEFYTEAVSSVANVQWIFSFGSNDFSAGTQVSAGSMATRFTIIRTSATTIRVVNNNNHIISDFTVSNMGSASNVIALKFLASSAGGATLKSVNYDYKRKSF